MDDKILLSEEETVAEVTVPEEEHSDASDVALIKRLRAEIKTLEGKEKELTKKLSVAKENGLDEVVSKCRALLQKTVRYKIDLRRELKAAELRHREAEAKRTMERLTEEIGNLTEEINALLPAVEEQEFETPLFEEEYDHLAKSKRLSLIARAVAWVGILGGLIGATIYMLLVVNAEIVFSWWPGMATYGIAAVAFVVIGLIIGGASRHHKRVAAEIAAEIEEQKAAYEAERAEQERLAYEANAPWLNDNMDAVTEAYAIERAGNRKRVGKRTLQKLIPDPENDDVKKAVHKLAPVAIACTAVAIAALTVSGKKKSAAKKSAALRREFFDWLT